MEYYGDPDDLEEFMEWWMFHKSIKPPTDALFFVPGICSIVLYRKGQFQVELFLAYPEQSVHRHKHPLTESYQITLAGDLSAMVNMTQVTEADHYYMATMLLPSDRWHKAATGKRGAAYLSIQKWLHNTPPTFLANSWQDQKKATSLLQYFEESK